MSNHYLSCESGSPFTELFVVEGKSALGAINQVRDKQNQAVLAMQGKPPNAAKLSRAKVLANDQVQRLVETLECGTGDQCRPERLKFHKICLLSDADPDGIHCQQLMMVLFQTLFEPLLEHEKVVTLACPLYRYTDGQQKTRYWWNESDKRRFIDQTGGAVTGTITRFKGLASLATNEKFDLLINRKTRSEHFVKPSDLPNERNQRQ